MNFHRRGALAWGTLAVVLLAGCTSTPSTPVGAGGSTGTPATSTSPTPSVEPVAVELNVAGRQVPVDSTVELTATGGTITDVLVKSTEGTLAGDLDTSGTQWTASDRLEPGTKYRLRATVEDASGSTQSVRRVFHTQNLTLDQQTYPSIAPLEGETVGVGMPVIVRFDVPVTDRASIEKHLHVTAKPAQRGSWHWISNREVHWRPAHYWKAGTQVHVDADINSISAGNGIYGQLSRSVDFSIGDRHIYKVNTKTDYMKVYSNGTLLRTIPVTTGKPGFTTRSGVKVIIEKDESRAMRSETIGIPTNSPDGYDLPDVQWAMRLTYSGEFIHAAPWSVAYQGHSNVSHGCTGMSTANADWLFHMTLRGDVVITHGTDRPMEPTNGWGDWNVPFKEYKQGSALS